MPLTAVAAWVLHRQVPSGSNLAGLVLAAGGFGLMTWPAGAAGLDPGDLLVLVTALTYAVIIVELGVAAPKHDVRVYTAGQIAFAFAGVLLGLGVTSLSMAPTAIPAVGVQLATVTLEQCRAAAQEVLATSTSLEAKERAAELL